MCSTDDVIDAADSITGGDGNGNGKKGNGGSGVGGFFGGGGLGGALIRGNPAVTETGRAINAVSHTSQINDLLNIYTNVRTLGLVGVDRNGHFGAGGVTHGIDEGIGQLTGRNLARRAQMDAEAAATQARLDQEKAIRDQQEYNRINDVNASNFAGLTRSAAARTAAQIGYGANPESKLTKDFLGLS